MGKTIFTYHKVASKPNHVAGLKWVEPISISFSEDLHPVVLTNQPHTGNEGHEGYNEGYEGYEGYEEKHEEGQWWGGASAKFQKSMAVRLKKEL